MAKALLIGVSFASELKTGVGHMACTLGGVNFESRGGKGCLKGSAARGAAAPMFRHHFHRILSDDEARRAKEYADACVGQPYNFGEVPRPDRPRVGGDCSGYVSGLVCASEGEKLRRLFATASFTPKGARALGFEPGFGNAAASTPEPIGVADRPFPGVPVERNSKKHEHVMWIQARLNFAAGGKHAVLGGKRLGVDGDFGDETLKVVKAFQREHGLEGLGMVGPKTWRLLNDVR